MFPRPSRLLRLIIFLSLLVFVTISMYVMSLDAGTGRSRMDNVMKGKMSSVEFIGSATGQDIGSDLFQEQQASSSLFPRRMSAQEEEEESAYFEKQVLQKLRGSLKLSYKKGTEPDALAQKTGDVLANAHDFKYIHNPSKLCQRDHVTFLVYIHSSPTNLKKRQAVRQTWGHPKLLRLYNATLIFVLGRISDPTVQKFIDMESDQYQDILQEDFIDSYRNLTHKGVAGLKWASIYCKQAEFMLKTDDDILVDIVGLMEQLYTRVIPERATTTKLILCNVWTRMKVIRDTKSKWYISKEEFPEEYFPPYCSGSAFLLSADLAPAMYDMALRTSFFWVDDYYITGMLVNKLAIKHSRFNQVYLLNYNLAEEKLKDDSKELLVFHVKKLSLFLKLWPLLMQRHKGLENYIRSISIPVGIYTPDKRNNSSSIRLNKTHILSDVVTLKSGKTVVGGNDRRNVSRSG